MAVISIMGTSGVGKSFLVRKLSLKNSCKAFYEGEENTIPKKIMIDVIGSKDPRKRFRYFVDKYKINLKKAQAISNKGNDCYVDGSPLNIIAIAMYERKKYRKELIKMISELENVWPDLNVLIKADEKTLKEHIDARRRKSEENNETLTRALFIQKEMIKIAKKRKDCIIIERTQHDFNRKKDLEEIQKRIMEKIY